MSLFVRQQREAPTFQGLQDQGYIPSRGGRKVGTAQVTDASAMRHSAVWACIRLRANLISTFPLDVYRRLDGVQVQMPTPPILSAPGGKEWPYHHWMYATQADLDRCGNAFGLITEVNALGLPARIELASATGCSVRTRTDGTIRYRIDGKEYTPDQVWHERQYPVAGLPVGLSPIAHAAWSIGEYLSLQQFAIDWFGGGAIPKAHLKNTAKRLGETERTTAKQWYQDTIANGDLFVTGADWEYDMIQAQQAGMEWIEGRKYGVTDVSRFFDAPSDLIEAAIAGSSVTYANVVQRNLQFLTMSLGPATIRRENTLTDLLPKPRYVKLNTSSLLRMDPKTQAEVFQIEIKNRYRTITEVRELLNLPPLTDADYQEFIDAFGEPKGGGDTADGEQPADQPAPDLVPAS